MRNTTTNVLSVARLFLIDGVRRYALIGLLLFAVAAQTGGLLFIDFIPRDIGRASNDFLFSITWFSGLIFLFFHAVHAAAWDDGRRVIHTFVARPIARYEYVLGMFIGLASLLLLLNLLLAVIGWVVLNMIYQALEGAYFYRLSLPHYLLAAVGLYAIELMILSVILFFSGVIRGHFPVLLLTLSYYLISSGLPVVRDALTSGAQQSSVAMQYLLKGLSAVFPNFSHFNFKAQVTAMVELPTVTSLITIFGFSIFYCLAFLWLAAWLFGKRDLQ